jgi:hypothetical protein
MQLNNPIYEKTFDDLRTLAREDLKINRHKLDIASEQQCTVFEKWYSILSSVESDIRNQESLLLRERARVGLHVRRQFPELSREGAITSKVSLSKSVGDLEDTLNKMKSYQFELKGIVESARQRKAMIRVLADLYIANYYDSIRPDGSKTHLEGTRRKRSN